MAAERDADTPTMRRRMVRDLGAIERVYAEWVPGETGMFVTVMVEELGETERMLSVEPNEIDRLIEVLEQARDDLPNTDRGAYLGEQEVSEVNE